MSEQSVVFMFSGQGSQYIGMGKELFLYEAHFRKWMERLDKTFAELTGRSVVERLYYSRDNERDRFDELLFSHAAIFMVEYSLAQVLMGRGVTPDFVLGYSMGEFASAATAGVMAAEDCMRCLVKQAELLAETCVPGGMTAVIGNPELFERSPQLQLHGELAAINFHTHFVVSARSESLLVLERHLRDMGAAFLRLPVSAAFHSSWIEPAAEAFLNFMSAIPIARPRIPYLSCVKDSRFDARGSAHYWDAVRQPVDFRGAFERVADKRNCVYIDLGPSGTLANFAKYNLGAESKDGIVAIMTPFGQELERIDTLCSRIGVAHVDG